MKKFFDCSEPLALCDFSNVSSSKKSGPRSSSNIAAGSSIELMGDVFGVPDSKISHEQFFVLCNRNEQFHSMKMAKLV